MTRRKKKRGIGLGTLSLEQWERQYRRDAARDGFREIAEELEVFGLPMDAEEIVNDTIRFAQEVISDPPAYPELGEWLVYHHREAGENCHCVLMEPMSPFPWARLFIDDLSQMDLGGLEMNSLYEVDSMCIANPDLSRLNDVDVEYMRNAIGYDYACDCYEYTDEIIPCFRRRTCYMYVSIDREPQVKKGTRVFRQGGKPFGAFGTVISRRGGTYGEIKVQFDNEKKPVSLDRSKIGGILDGDWS